MLSSIRIQIPTIPNRRQNSNAKSFLSAEPVDYFWNRSSKPGSCLDADILIAIAYTYSVGAALFGNELTSKALNLAFAICTLVGCSYGMGQKQDYFRSRPDYYRRALLCWWLGQFFYIITCVPVDYFWNRSSKPGSCLDADILIAIAYTYSVGAAITDFTIGILPVFIIWSLRMNTRTKMAIAGILGIGCIASAAVIVRIPFVHNYKDPDFFYATYQISIWSNVEAGLGITAGSLTTLRPLVRFLRDGSSVSRSQQRTPGSFPLSGNIPKGLTRRSKPDEGVDDARRLWTGMADEEYQGITTTIITGSHPTKRGESEDSLTG
ncbi:hypothetical protein KXV69_001916 [Aspergillus fumigatus]|nr:hypothetical protein KXV69_001916 [Aspergillus fumigatus]